MITVGNTSPSTAQAGGAGRMFALHVALAGTTPGSYFSKVRAKLRNNIASVVNARVVVYSGTALVDWAAFTLPASAPTQIFEVTLTGAVVVTDGTYKIGVQAADANTDFFITTGTADTTSFTSTTTYGAAPPNPWTPGSTFSWTTAFAADVETPAAAAAFVPRIAIL